MLHRKDKTVLLDYHDDTKRILSRKRSTIFNYFFLALIVAIILYVFLLFHKYSFTQKPISRLDHSAPSQGLFQPPLATISPTPLTQHYHLVVGVGTIARFDTVQKQYKTYVVDTIESLTSQLDKFFDHPDNEKILPKDKRVLIYAQDNTNDVNPPFDNFLKKGALISRSRYDVLLYKNRNRFVDPFEDIPTHDYTFPGNELAGHNARQQNSDVISLTKHLLRYVDFDHFLFMEDDFRTCDKMPWETFRTLEELNKRDPDHCGLRVSYGMNGLILPRKDLENFIHYFSHHIDMLPIDLIIRKYSFETSPLYGLKNEPLPFNSCGKDRRKQYTYKTVLQEHIGQISTYFERNNAGFRPSFPGCGFSMAEVWNLNRDELFDLEKCGAWSISPCNLDGTPF
jgi:hypothetical protein